MKKRLVVAALSLLVTMTMLIGFAACGNEKNPSEDKTETATTTTAVTTTAPTTAPQNDLFLVGIWKGQMNGIVASEGKEDEFVDVTMEFKRDGTFMMTVDAEQLWEYVAQYEYDMTFSEFLEESGITKEQAFEMVKNETTASGNYTFDGKTLVIDGKEQAFVLNDQTLEIENEGKKMQLTRT